DVRFVQSTKNH
ncbi:hypothetical protein D030_1694B, partial [Vibrio parahaemolyticus AQ3810]